jgi:chromosome segregation and condensation protein ScpB
MTYIPEWIPLTRTEVKTLEAFRRRSAPPKGVGDRTISKLMSRKLIETAGREENYAPMNYALTVEGDAAIKITALYTSGKLEHDRRFMIVYRKKANMVELFEALRKEIE